jgi:hypothetical protein
VKKSAPRELSGGERFLVPLFFALVTVEHGQPWHAESLDVAMDALQARRSSPGRRGAFRPSTPEPKQGDA